MCNYTIFETAYFNKPDKNVRMAIFTSSGHDISDVADGIKYRNYKSKEILITPRKKFKILEYYQKDGIHYITMTEI